MIAKRHLSAAPIKEALIDIKVALPEKVNTERLKSGYSQVSDRYPTIDTLHKGELRIQLDGSPHGDMTVDTANSTTFAGYRCISADDLNTVQFRVDGFTFSRLESYDSWDELKREAVRLWKIYSNSVSPSLVARIATRYINQLKLPRNSNINEYLAAPPVIPDGLDLELSRFLTQIAIKMPSIGAQGIVTQGWNGRNDNNMTVLLDIDVYIEKQFDPQNGEIWKSFDRLRELKNDIFFHSITEKTAKLYQ